MRTGCAPSWINTTTSSPIISATTGRATAAPPTSASSRCCRTGTAPTASSWPACGRPAGDGRNTARRAGAGHSPAVPRLRRAVAASHEPAGPLPLRVLPAPLRAALGLPGLRGAFHNRADVRYGKRDMPQLRRQHAHADLAGGGDLHRYPVQHGITGHRLDIELVGEQVAVHAGVP